MEALNGQLEAEIHQLLRVEELTLSNQLSELRPHRESHPSLVPPPANVPTDDLKFDFVAHKNTELLECNLSLQHEISTVQKKYSQQQKRIKQMNREIQALRQQVIHSDRSVFSSLQSQLQHSLDPIKPEHDYRHEQPELDSELESLYTFPKGAEYPVLKAKIWSERKESQRLYRLLEQTQEKFEKSETSRITFQKQTRQFIHEQHHKVLGTVRKLDFVRQENEHYHRQQQEHQRYIRSLEKKILQLNRCIKRSTGGNPFLQSDLTSEPSISMSHKDRDATEIQQHQEYHDLAPKDRKDDTSSSTSDDVKETLLYQDFMAYLEEEESRES